MNTNDYIFLLTYLLVDLVQTIRGKYSKNKVFH